MSVDAPSNAGRPAVGSIPFYTPGTGLAALGAIVIGLAQGLTAPTTADHGLVVALGIVAAVAASVGVAWAERRRPTALGPIVALALASSLAAVWLTVGHAYVMVLPAVSFAVLYFSLRTAAIISVATVVVFAAAISAHGVAAWPTAGKALGFGSAVLFVGVFSHFAKRQRWARREVELLSAQVEELATAKERNRISRELHDTLGHVLTVANVQLEAARSSAEGRDERLERVQQLLKAGLADLRRVVSLWRESPMTAAPLATALAQLAEHTEATGLRVTLETFGAPRLVSPEASFALYRGAQEALTNVHRHARATAVTLALTYEPTAVGLRIADDGIGAPTLVFGNGLNGLNERLKPLGGSLAVGSVHPSGLALTLRVQA